jgi:hypothetical protein
MNNTLTFSNEKGSIEYYNTPWNSRIIGGESLEICSVDYTDKTGPALLSDFSSLKSSEGYKLLSTRIPATSRELKKLYNESGFHIVEHTLDIVSNKLDIEKLQTLSRIFPVTIEDYKPDDIGQLQEIAESQFRFGRFFEDPLIDPELARERNRLWIEDLIKQGARIVLSRKDKKVIGFIAYKVIDNKANLILGGVRSECRFYAYSFWTQVLLTLKDVAEIRSLLSSSNINTINLYATMGFRFDNPQFGFHKHLNIKPD